MTQMAQQQKNTASEQLQARLHQKEHWEEKPVQEGSEEYAECYPATYELQSFWDFRAGDAGGTQRGTQRPQRAKTRDEKIARDLNKLEQWKRNARDRGESPEAAVRKRSRPLPPLDDNN